jgi:hypothetical protein
MVYKLTRANEGKEQTAPFPIDSSKRSHINEYSFLNDTTDFRKIKLINQMLLYEPKCLFIARSFIFYRIKNVLNRKKLKTFYSKMVYKLTRANEGKEQTAPFPH